MTTAPLADSVTFTERNPPGLRMPLLLVVFALSGAAGLIYEVVWFQLLRLVIGANSQSLGLLLACFMGGLFLGSLLYSRVIPRRWDPLKTYAVMELLIALFGVALPWLVSALRTVYWTNADAPTITLVLRSLICVGLLLPPTTLMGATLPALARWVRVDDRQAASIGRLYAANITGAVAGTLGGALVLLPMLGVVSANLVAVGFNLLVAVLAIALAGGYAPAAAPATTSDRVQHALPVYLAYALNGVAALAFEVIWSRLLAMIFGATVYAFAMVLGVFLLALGIGGWVGSAIAPRLQRPRWTLGAVQLAVVAAVSGTAMLIPFVARCFADFDQAHLDQPWLLTLTNFGRALIVVFPGAFCWGLAFPIAIAGLGRDLGDAARPVGRLYAFNTVGSVVGSLAASFVLIPTLGSQTATAQLIVIPLAAALIVLLPRRAPAVCLWLIAAAAIAVGLASGWPTAWNRAVVDGAWGIAHWTMTGWIIAVPVTVAGAMILGTWVRHWWAFLLAGCGVIVALGDRVPIAIYLAGRSFPHLIYASHVDEVLYFGEGAMEPIVVFRNTAGHKEIAINSKICASTVPNDMIVQRLLGHLPVLLSDDPARTLVVGLGAGITAGAVAIHDDVDLVDVAELEPMVIGGAKAFADVNFDVVDDPKTRINIADGRHWIATTGARYGVITSDPIAPFLAGAAALYTVEYYQAARHKLIEGGIFTQWMGMAGMDEEGVKSLLAAFGEVFPDGQIWVTPVDIMMVGSTRPIRIDVPALRAKLDAQPRVKMSLADVGIDSVEQLLSSFWCTAKDLDDFLVDARINRDANLVIQYTGWQAFYRYYDQNLVRMQDIIGRLRRYHPAVFVLPDAQRPAFEVTLRAHWAVYDDRVAAGLAGLPD